MCVIYSPQQEKKRGNLLLFSNIYFLNPTYFIFCRRYYKVKFDIDPGYIFQTALTISLS